ncbi:hypothetical protein [Streptomyces griseoruber]|uniref:Uncharacterized protein n=1 Tax=Streptomyces griseoruber TaxID=1943 RepID=A0A101SQM8_9ACTN|nr:hypothetical protein [Streptomyces griseoruber]KUN78370.1 hypothetical protein AQJ64_30750 [Streptomyces griseoruber]
MAVFVCARCDAVLTAPVSEVALPAHAHHSFGHDMLPPLMEPGTYAVDPEPHGPPWKPWSEIGEDEAAARGVFARARRFHSLPCGASGAVAVAPGDTRAMVLIPERCDGYCLGLDGRDGPNLACARCGRPVATRVDDCSLWQVVWLAPDAVRRLPVEGPADRILDWETLAQERRSTPPVEQLGYWNPQWEAAVGVALAHVLVASGGAPLAVPGGLLADTFGRALDALLPKGPPAKRLALAGPGLPGTDADIVLVPLHPQTGQAWQPRPPSVGVPLAAGVWMHLAFPQEQVPPIPVTGGLPDGFLRDDPLPLRPQWLFRADARVLLGTLARLPAVREPWLRGIFDRVDGQGYARPF